MKIILSTFIKYDNTATPHFPQDSLIRLKKNDESWLATMTKVNSQWKLSKLIEKPLIERYEIWPS